jgi:hypothetical protein
MSAKDVLLWKTNKDISLRLMNVSSQPKTLYEGTVIAKVSPVSEIASPLSGKIHSKTELPPYFTLWRYNNGFRNRDP